MGQGILVPLLDLHRMSSHGSHVMASSPSRVVKYNTSPLRLFIRLYVVFFCWWRNIWGFSFRVGMRICEASWLGCLESILTLSDHFFLLALGYRGILSLFYPSLHLLQLLNQYLDFLEEMQSWRQAVINPLAAGDTSLKDSWKNLEDKHAMELRSLKRQFTYYR